MKWMATACVLLFLIAAALVHLLTAGEAVVADTNDRSKANRPIEYINESQGKAENAPRATPFSKPVREGSSSTGFSSAGSTEVNAVLSNDGNTSRPRCSTTPAKTGVHDFSDYTDGPDAKIAITDAPLLDKEQCHAAAGEIAKSRWRWYDVTATQVVTYNARPGTHLHELPHFLASRMCLGNRRFEPTLVSTFEIVTVTADASTRILVGQYWVSDGTIVTPLTEAQYAIIARKLGGRRRQGIGPAANMARAEFDQRLLDGTLNRLVAEFHEQQRRDEKLRRAQQGLPMDCID